MNRFRPQDLPQSFVMKQRLKTGHSDNYNWQTRVRWYRAKDGINRRFIVRLFQYLHYYACHAPAPIQAHWKNAYRKFGNRYFASQGQASVRYLNTRTSHSWL